MILSIFEMIIFHFFFFLQNVRKSAFELPTTVLTEILRAGEEAIEADIFSPRILSNLHSFFFFSTLSYRVRRYRLIHFEATAL